MRKDGPWWLSENPVGTSCLIHNPILLERNDAGETLVNTRKEEKKEAKKETIGGASWQPLKGENFDSHLPRGVLSPGFFNNGTITICGMVSCYENPDEDEAK